MPLRGTSLCYYTPIFQVACQLSLYFLLVPYNVSPLQAAMVPKDELAMGARMHNQVRYSMLHVYVVQKISRNALYCQVVGILNI